MIAVKVECDCGQHYAFDVEPVNRRMPHPVACPACGADGTSAADEIIGQHPESISEDEDIFRMPPVLPSVPPPLPPSSSSRPGPRGGSRIQARDPEQVEHEARAKMSWGDPPEAVVKFVMLEGFGAQAATDLVARLTTERTVAVRAKGVKKIMIGFGLICVPIVALIFFSHMKVIPLKLMGIAMAIGLWGAWQALNGLIMLLAPKMETGDLADD